MAKLVLFLADGTTLDIPLARERVTIGRRADNDVCLPNLAVSGEHAAVVTILADSFLEDLGSTNGTLVNGAAVTKHFLRDGDQIDLGRQILTYVVDDAATLEPPPRSGKSLDGTPQGESTDATLVAPAALRAKRRSDFVAPITVSPTEIVDRDEETGNEDALSAPRAEPEAAPPAAIMAREPEA